MNPLVSVVMATHNRAHLVPSAVSSILNQSYQNIELIIIDDASTDNTKMVLEEICARDARVKLICSTTNVGPGKARNLGVSCAEGEYVAIMDDDDYAVPERIERQYKAFQMNPDVQLVFSSVIWIDSEGRKVGSFPGIVEKGNFPEPPDKIFELLYLESSKIPNPTVMIRSEVIRANEYPEFPWGVEDWYWLLRLAALGFKMKAISEPLVLMNRDVNHKKFTDRSDQSFKRQEQVLKEMVGWLKDNNITRFDHLRRRAASNLFMRRAQHGGWKGLLYLTKSFFLCPDYSAAKKILHQKYIARLKSKLFKTS